VNIDAFEQLKRVLAGVPAHEFDLMNWHNCACGHATQDPWFVAQGFSSCNDFGRAAVFFHISRDEASELFSARTAVTPVQLIELIDGFLAQTPRTAEPSARERRQAVIDSLLIKANRAAQATRRIATTLILALF
jgi:hypothetical protein